MKFQVFCLIFLIIDAIVVITFASSNKHQRRNKNSHEDLTNIDCNDLRRHYNAQNHKNFNHHDTKLQLLCELNTDTNISDDTTTDETSELSVENKTVQCVGKKCVYKRKLNSSFNKSDSSSNESSQDKHIHHSGSDDSSSNRYALDSSHKSKRSITSFRREHCHHDRPPHHHGRNSHHKHNHHRHHHHKQHPRYHHNSEPHHFHQTPNHHRPGHKPRHHRRYPDFYNSSEEYLAKCKYKRGRNKYYKCKDKYINSNPINQKLWIVSTTTNDLPSVTSTTPLPPNIFKISTTELPPPKIPGNNFEAISSTEPTSTTEKPIETTTEIDLSLYARADIQTKPPCTQHTSVVEQTDEKFLYFNGENVQYEINLCNN